LYKLENEEFLNEPTYVHRCQLVDDQVQRETLQKYLDLIKSGPSKNDSDDMDDGYDRDENLNTSHILIENIEIDINCLSKELTKINPKYDLMSYQYTIKVVDFKRIKSGFSNNKSIDASECDESRSQQTCTMDSFYANKSIEILLNKDKICADDTAENTCAAPNSQQQNLSTYLNNTTGSTSILSCHVSSSLKLPTIDSNLKEKQNSLNDNELNQNETLYAISESTRIQHADDNNTYMDDIDDLTQTSISLNKDKDATLANSCSNRVVSLGDNYKNEANFLKDLIKINQKRMG
jgi:hypothetical protein